jgi:hypothetical protein
MAARSPPSRRGARQPENPLADEELARKYFAYAEPVLGAARAARIERAVRSLPTDPAALLRCSTTSCDPFS